MYRVIMVRTISYTRAVRNSVEFFPVMSREICYEYISTKLWTVDIYCALTVFFREPNDTIFVSIFLSRLKRYMDNRLRNNAHSIR